MKNFFTLLFSLLSTFVLAQDRPNILPEDIEHNTLDLKCFCKPGIQNKTRSRGVELAYNFVQGGEFDDDKEDLTQPLSDLNHLRNLIFKLKVPFINTEGLKILAGFSYQTERYRFDFVSPGKPDVFNHITDRKLKHTSFSLLGVKPLDEKFYLSGQVKVNFTGDFEGLTALKNRYADYNISGLVGIKKNVDFEWGVGFSFSAGFRSTTTFIPFILYNRNINPKWGLEMVLPAYIMGRYNFSASTIMSFGPKYNSKSYSIDVFNTTSNEAQIYGMNHSEIRFMLSLEQQLHPWIWFNMEVGYQDNFSTDFETLQGSDVSFEVEMKNSPYIRFGLFISPPDTFLK